MNRQDILNDYFVNAQGIIQSPGKFEAEMLYVPYFWDMTLDGSADPLHWSDGATTYIVEIDDADRAAFPELPADAFCVHMQESETGFVYCYLLTQAEYDALIAENEADTADEGECE